MLNVKTDMCVVVASFIFVFIFQILKLTDEHPLLITVLFHLWCRVVQCLYTYM
mgnify:CR=1 FL=1